MSLYNFFMYGCLFLSALVIAMHIYAACYFKAHQVAYQDFIDRYQKAGLQLDLTTKFANNLGFYANYQKIAFFMNLRKGRKMRFSQTEKVSIRAYDFVQQQPQENVAWMEKTLHLYQFTFCMTFVWVFFMSIFIYVLN
ncbi:hypothetical protein NGC37_10180 [Pantoea anthophila]|uniref:hypothetical protein n=1 Tax=Pantoea anthophila TaxID=470931 RepID=UPI002DB9B959|nr:hypothetical protein [Pantoea anthophila]MEB7538680.1 hypothetical protein [Pantoea anthophila]